MREAVQCPACGAELPRGLSAGLCPACVLRDEEAVRSAPAVTGVVRENLDFGDYELLEEIARGGMGVVYKARQKSLDRVVAVKMILAGQFASKEEVLRFRAEAESAARLQHPNIVRIHETGEVDGQPYFSMDYVEGQNLSELVRDHPLPVKRAAGCVRTIAEAIHFAHEHGVLHRDLKPSNIMIDQYDQPRVLDFGLAKRVQDGTFLTLSGQVLGSPHFMPPEQAKGAGKAGRHNDVYAAGAVLFYLITGRTPFRGRTIAEILEQVLNGELVAPQLINPSVPENLAAICLKCLQKDSSRRYRTAQELADELGRFLRDEPVKARGVSWTRFNHTLWANSEYSRSYLDRADRIIPDRRYLFHIVHSFMRHFGEREPIRVCDLGCGDGALAEHLLTGNPHWELLLVDGYPGMIAAAERRLRGRENVQIRQATFDAMIRGEIDLGTFDFIVSVLAIHHLTHSERVALFHWLHQHLTPGGWFLNVDAVHPDEMRFLDWQYELWREWIVQTERQHGASDSLRGSPDEARRNPDNKLSRLATQLSALRSIGFVDVDCMYRNGIFAVYCGHKSEDIRITAQP